MKLQLSVAKRILMFDNKQQKFSRRFFLYCKIDFTK